MDYESASYPGPDQGPDKSTPWTIGLLNVIFGALLLIWGICSGLSFGMQSAMAPRMEQLQRQLQQAVEADRQAQLSRLKEREKGIQDEKEKAKLRAREKSLRAQPVPALPDTTRMFKNPALLPYSLADTFSGLILNVLMVIAGLGLMSHQSWGRKLALWVAALKIIRLPILYGYFIKVIVPILEDGFAEMFKEMAESMPPTPGGPGPQQMQAMGTTIGILMRVFAIGMIVLGAIYPVIVLIALTRPRARAAFSREEPTGTF
jgi:hypothetical protein